MKAITIKQPWASLIVHGIKNIENRTWRCPKKYIGQRVLIHASANKRGGWTLNNDQAGSLYRSKSVLYRTDFDNLPFGSIIGSVQIVDCVVNHPSIWAEKTEVKVDESGLPYYGDKTYNWVLANPILFKEPILVKGKLSFWDFVGLKEVKIEFLECGSVEIALEDYTTAPFPSFLHSCNKCGYVIMESEWNIIK